MCRHRVVSSCGVHIPSRRRRTTPVPINSTSRSRGCRRARRRTRCTTSAKARSSRRTLPALYVATGSGLAPFRGLLQEELAQPNGPPVRLLFGCRTQADILWRDELERWDKDVPRFSLTVTLSRPDGDWRRATGYVQTHVASLVARLRPGVVLLCGLSPMTHAVERTLLAEGVDG